MELQWNCNICTYSNNFNMNYCEMCTNPVMNDDTFIIYTTGIANWGDINTVLKSWIENNILENILSMIPSFYKNVQIHHYDPIINVTETSIPKNLINEIQTRLYTNDINYPRIIQSLFFQERLLDVKLKKNYIIIDFAHVFKYTKKRDVVEIAGNYKESNKEEKKLKTVYIGFIGNSIDLKNNDCISHRIIKSNFFRVKDNRTVETYIDSMIENNYNFDPMYPQDKIVEIVSVIKKFLMGVWREKNGIVNDDFDEIFNGDFLLLLVKNILNNIFNGFNESVLISLCTNYAFDNFF
ncbi:hypothetical protein CPAV1605_1212 [seawater metagenome]|uniref:RanBP2-type domain-containing protein n=1 Tax=seawater metagenome TaxID=1561972 RepID=A0A5E8CJJ7_9ZZZZ